jgi:transglutaminase-like putative cysteine protease
LTLENRERIDYALIMDCPELLYYPQGETMDSLRYGRIQAPDEALCAQHAAMLPDRLAEWLEGLDAIRRQPEWGGTDFEKEIAADRFLVHHCIYEPEMIDVTNNNFEQHLELFGARSTAYSALIEGRAICGGYASAMTLAMRCFGVPCLSTTGFVYPGNGSYIGHEWNIIQIGGEWTHEDVTFNDCDDEVYTEDYFPHTNLTSTEIFQYVRNDALKAGMKLRDPFSTSDRNNYYLRKGQTLGADWQAEAVRRVQEAHDAGRHAIGFRMLDSAAFEEAARMVDSEDMSVFASLDFPVTVDYTWNAHALYISWE